MVEIKPDELYTTGEVRDFLKVSDSTIKRYLKKGIISAYKVGGRYRVMGKEVLRLVSPKVENNAKILYKKAKNKTKRLIQNW